uniref:Uncharacterized protein n=1 Tax=Bostrychia moritziana TaxID=103713 RepID=A0A1Z1M6Z7_BOSMO|nr:hypothetical protein [Bostrychia moritziana]ARW61611.1 hypothetical protein [Bostrychia moritziana]
MNYCSSLLLSLLIKYNIIIKYKQYIKKYLKNYLL